jgi:hypothetical protein
MGEKDPFALAIILWPLNSLAEVPEGRGASAVIIVERLWRSLKYECIYLNAYEGGSETRRGIGSWVKLYNRRRPHSSLDDRTPCEAYWRLPRKGYRYKAA